MTRVRVLIVKSWGQNVEPVLVALRRGGYDPEGAWGTVDTEAALHAALARGGWDVVLHDPACNLPHELVSAAIERRSKGLPLVGIEHHDQLPIDLARALASRPPSGG